MRLIGVVWVANYLSPPLDLFIIHDQPKLHGIQLPPFLEVYLKNSRLKKIGFLSVVIYVRREGRGSSIKQLLHCKKQIM